MNPEPYLETPHYRHPSAGTLSSDEYEAGAESSASSMDNHGVAGYKKHSSSSPGHPHKQPQPLLLQSLANSKQQSLSAFATPPQSSPQSIRDDGLHHNDNGRSSYQYSSGSEEDLDTFSQEPALLGDLAGTSSAYRVRRDSGSLKMTAAKRLPAFSASLSSLPSESLIEEEEEEDEQEDRYAGSRRQDHADELENEMEGVLQGKGTVDQNDEVDVRDRNMDTRHVNNLPRTLENGGSKSR